MRWCFLEGTRTMTSCKTASIRRLLVAVALASRPWTSTGLVQTRFTASSTRTHGQGSTALSWAGKRRRYDGSSFLAASSTATTIVAEEEKDGPENEASAQPYSPSSPLLLPPMSLPPKEMYGGASGILKTFLTSTQGFLRSRRDRRLLLSDQSEAETKAAKTERVRVRDADWSKLGSLAFADFGVLVCSSLSLVLAAACDVAIPACSASALAAVVAGDSNKFSLAMRGLVKFSVGSAIFTGLRGCLFWISGARVVSRLRQQLFRNLLRQDIPFFDVHETGELTSRLGADSAKLANVVSFHVNIIVRQALQALGGLACLFKLNGKMALVSLAGLGLVALISGLNGSFSRWLSKQVQDELADANSVAEQSLGLVRLVRVHAAEEREYRRYQAVLRRVLLLQETQGVAYGLSRFVATLAQLVVSGTMLVCGRRAVMSGAMDGAALTTFLFYVTFIGNASFDVGEQWTRIQEAFGAGDTVFRMTDREPVHTSTNAEAQKKNNPEEAQKKRATAVSRAASALRADRNDDRDTAGPKVKETILPVAGSLSFDDVDFTYPSRPGAQVLKRLSLSVASGEVLGLVGGSGGGKSTILRLLSGFYDPDAGTVRLNGLDVTRDYSKEELSRRIAWVTQEPQLFPISIAENIAYGLEPGSWTLADVEAVAKLANVHAFAASLPNGYDTLVGEGGNSLSGGQRQRVAIARALMRNPEVLLLDEPTSALDADSEALVQSALKNAFSGRTVVIVAHRLATIQDADRVVVLKNGSVLEDGPPAELRSRPGGAFAELLQKQSLVLA